MSVQQADSTQSELKHRSGCLVLFTLALLIGGLFWGIWRGLMEAPVGSRGEVEPWMKTLEEESSSENEEALR
ncbi:MAG: hypothetical protein VYD19_02205 [Myxococcota bacterium]|nr:hypothetical protein [Myxococcota bacterium]